MPVEHKSTRKRLAKHTANGLYIAQHPAALDHQKRFSTEYVVSRQDPILGIHKKNLTPVITLNNWRHKALLTHCDGKELYIHISQGEIRRLNQRIFSINGYCTKQKKVIWSQKFLTIEECLCWLKSKYRENPGHLQHSQHQTICTQAIA